MPSCSTLAATIEEEYLMSHPSAFWDRIARRYAKSPVADEAAYRHKLEVTRQYFRPDTRVLEFACGTGSTAIEHAPWVGHYLATDFSAGMLEIARSKAAGVANLEFDQATLQQLPGEGRFDVILGMSILHLVEDLDDTLTQVHRLLVPGGVFVSSTMCMSDRHGWFRLVGPIGYHLGLFPRVNMFSRAQLEERIVAAGFRLEYRYQPSPGKATFIVATRVETTH